MHARKRWRTVDDDQSKDAAPEQEIGGPRASAGIGWTDDHKPLPDIGPWGRREGASGIDPRHPRSAMQHLRDHLPQESRLSNR
jgi:hypothetical protein